MVSITISMEISSEQASRVVDAFTESYNYQEIIDEEANTESKADFTKRMVKDYVKNVVKGYEANVARQEAMDLLSEAEDLVIA